MDMLDVRTSGREALVNVTDQVRAVIEKKGWRSGALLLFCPHTTAGVTINEAADPSVARDIVTCLRKLIPQAGNYLHGEGNSDAHIKTALVGPSLLVPVEDGALQLGTWQGIFFCEFDGPRARRLWLTWLPA